MPEVSPLPHTIPALRPASYPQIPRTTPNKNSPSIEETHAEVKDVDERAQIGIDAARERAADANRRNIAKLRGAIENIDDYKLQASANVSFGFDKWALSKDAGQELDKSAGEAKR